MCKNCFFQHPKLCAVGISYFTTEIHPHFGISPAPQRRESFFVAFLGGGHGNVAASPSTDPKELARMKAMEEELDANKVGAFRSNSVFRASKECTQSCSCD
jgi:hypothetical protein